jgi:hypothetical protein
MKANELRIGNYVKYYGNSKTYKIDGINTDAEIWGNQGYIRSGSAKISIDAIKPIPITEEWLLKFGLLKSGSVFFIDDYYIIFRENNIQELGFDVDYGFYVLAEFEYVHQLQNLIFALTGKELNYAK